jgi:hypothetical protein
MVPEFSKPRLLLSGGGSAISKPAAASSRLIPAPFPGPSSTPGAAFSCMGHFGNALIKVGTRLIQRRTTMGRFLALFSADPLLGREKQSLGIEGTTCRMRHRIGRHFGGPLGFPRLVQPLERLFTFCLAATEKGSPPAALNLTHNITGVRDWETGV